MMTCGGQKPTGNCHSIIYKCTKCGAVGCKTKGCTNQKFDAGKCLCCGSYGTTKEA